MNKIILLFLIIFTSQFCLSQDFSRMRGSEYCSYKKTHNKNSLKLSGDSPNTPKHAYDVLDYTLNLDIYNCFLSPYSHGFTASDKITLKVDSSSNTIKLYATNTSIIIDSIRSIGGPLFSFSQGPIFCNIDLDRTYDPGEIIVMQIFYRHQDVTDNSFYASNGMVFTDCEPEGARNWFPCWDKPSDKATLDLTAKVPSSVKLGSNGKLIDSIATGDTIYYHWKSSNPISTYLIVMSAKVNYGLDIVYWHKLSTPADSIQIRFYYNSGENPGIVENLIVDMCDFYSTKFIEHPFEKNGFCTLNNEFYWGGMENQTLTNFCPGCWSEWLTSHEFAHQWFGDMITCGTWADIWLNEGFATYCEALWDEHRNGGYAVYKSDIDNDALGYLNNNPGWAMYNPSWVDSTPDVNTLFNNAITYEKGACVLHMLRYTLGDSIFFKCLKVYASDTVNFKFKNSVTKDFANKISRIAGENLNWFIDQWVRQPNHPVYANEYGIENIGTNQWAVNFLASQIQTNSAFHKMPIELQISFKSGPDTIVRVMNDVNDQLFSFTFNNQPTNVVFDPNNNIVLKESSLILGIHKNQGNNLPGKFALYQNEPNPFNPVTKISFDIPKDSKVKLVIYDILGKEITTLVNDNLKSGSYTKEWNATRYPSGVYFYRLIAGTFSDVKKMVVIK